MMKKIYKKPTISFADLELEELIAMSVEINGDEEDDGNSSKVKGQSLNLWDEEW